MGIFRRWLEARNLTDFQRERGIRQFGYGDINNTRANYPSRRLIPPDDLDDPKYADPFRDTDDGRGDESHPEFGDRLSNDDMTTLMMLFDRVLDSEDPKADMPEFLLKLKLALSRTKYLHDIVKVFDYNEPIQMYTQKTIANAVQKLRYLKQYASDPTASQEAGFLERVIDLLKRAGTTLQSGKNREDWFVKQGQKSRPRPSNRYAGYKTGKDIRDMRDFFGINDQPIVIW